MSQQDTGKSSPKVLPYVHASEPAKQILEYIDQRRKGKISSLKTPWRKMNQVTMNGLEFSSIISIGGMSGSGKSSIASQLEDGLIELNPEYQLAILDFSLEMLSQRVIGRKIGAKLGLSVQQMYSGRGDFKVDDETYAKIKAEADRIAKHNISYVDMPGSAEDIYWTIIDFWQKNKGKGIVIFLDHSLLTKGKSGDKERETLMHLMTMFNAVKKITGAIIIILSQLNRDIESSERIQNPDLHFPRKQDFFGSDALYMYSDIVLVAHRPEMLQIQRYGRAGWPTQNMVFFHYLKVRDGEPCIAAMVNDLAHNKILDYTPPNVEQQTI
jgi:replicative DNA helicase